MSINDPFLLIPAGKDYLWGGTRLKTEYGKDFLDLEPLAETWECSTHPDGESTVGSGVFKGRKLSEVLKEHPEFLGVSQKTAPGQLPILVKLIDAKQDLSVQVHPDDAYAWEHENHQQGKTEMWVVLDAEPGASLVYGVQHAVTAEELRTSAENGTVMNHLNRVPVKAGDAFFIEAGTIHAIGKGLLIAEIQENSNLTYRLYDYDRIGKDGKKRPLHLDKAVAVSRLTPNERKGRLLKIRRYQPGGWSEEIVLAGYFKVERCCVRGSTALPLDPFSLNCLMVINGALKIFSGERVLFWMEKGASCLIPRNSVEIRIDGEAEFLQIKS